MSLAQVEITLNLQKNYRTFTLVNIKKKKFCQAEDASRLVSALIPALSLICVYM